MRMNPLLRRALLAALPLLGITLGAKTGFLYGLLGAGVFLLATVIFLTTRVVIPESLHRLGLFLLLSMLGVLAAENFSKEALSPLLVLSLFILSPSQFRPRGRNWNRDLPETALASVFFWALLTGHGVLSEFLGLRWGWGVFQLPAGSYLLIGSALAIINTRKAARI